MFKGIIYKDSKKIVEELEKTNDLTTFIKQLSEGFSWYSIYSRHNRKLFEEYIIEELKNKKIGIYQK